MSKWGDRILNHAVFGQLDQVGSLLERLEPAAAKTAEGLEALGRIQSLYHLLKASLDTINPEMCLPGPLDTMNAQLGNIIGEANAFIGDQNYGHLENANSHVDAALSQLAQINSMRSPADFEAVREAAQAFRRSVGQHARYLESTMQGARAEIGKLKDRLGELSNDFAQQKAQLQTVTAEFQSQFSQAQERRIQDFSDTLRKITDEFKENIDTWQQEMEATTKNIETESKQRLAKNEERLSEYEQQFAESMSGFSGTVEVNLHTMEQKFDDAIESTKTQAGVTFAKLDSYNERANALLGIIAEKSVTSSYQKAADKARKQTNIWHSITVASMLGLVATALFAFLPTLTGTFSWGGFAGRVFVTLTVGVLAAYGADQANRYSRLERQNRKMELDLAAVGPYLAELDEAKQEEFKLQLADRIFGRQEEAKFQLEDGGPSSVVDLFLKSKEFKAVLTEVVKAAK